MPFSHFKHPNYKTNLNSTVIPGALNISVAKRMQSDESKLLHVVTDQMMNPSMSQPKPTEKAKQSKSQASSPGPIKQNIIPAPVQRGILALDNDTSMLIGEEDAVDASRNNAAVAQMQESFQNRLIKNKIHQKLALEDARSPSNDEHNQGTSDSEAEEPIGNQHDARPFSLDLRR